VDKFKWTENKRPVTIEHKSLYDARGEKDVPVYFKEREPSFEYIYQGYTQSENTFSLSYDAHKEIGI
jgi:hypothetical protein